MERHEPNCAPYRELLSALLDGEDVSGRVDLLEAHMSHCAACRDWFDDAAEVTRMARIAPAENGPDVATAVLDQFSWPTRSRGVLVRWSLGVVGAAQTALSVAALIGVNLMPPHGHAGMLGASMTHMAHETEAWNLALGIAFVWAALRVRHAAGQIPVTGTFVVVLGGLSLADYLAGGVNPLRLAAHLLAVLGLLLIILLVKTFPTPRDRVPAGGARRREPSPEPGAPPPDIAGHISEQEKGESARDDERRTG